MLQPFPFVYLCFCLHHILSSLGHKPVQKALIYFSMAHFVKRFVLMKVATCMCCLFSHGCSCKYIYCNCKDPLSSEVLLISLYMRLE